jgi:hypothetical protein
MFQYILQNAECPEFLGMKCHAPQCYIKMALLNIILVIVRFAVLTAVTMKSAFWDVMLYSLVDRYHV